MATTERYSSEICVKIAYMTHLHLATSRNKAICYSRTGSDLWVVAYAQPEVTFKPPKKRGKLKFYWTL